MPERSAPLLRSPRHLPRRLGSSWQERTTWGLTGLLFVVFMVSGGAKVLGASQVVANFDAWGYSLSFRLFIGFCEIVGAAGLMVPGLAVSACAGLVGILLGAIYTHILHGESPAFAAVVLLCVVVLLRMRWERAFFTRNPAGAPREP